ncbi:phage portal protein, partial [Paraburkholderia nodosa]|uniref:phage portal protein n=1 Tax=Paraburkholderia nodosa TaxID=392320 RepID=UPI0004B0623B
MRLPFGLEIVRSAPRDLAPVASQALSPAGPGNGGWFPLVIREPFAGAWQQNVELKPETLLAFHAVYACVTLISADIGKLDVRLMQRGRHDVWDDVHNPAFSPVLREPNHFQTPTQFVENWIMSKLTRGNTYALKERDERNVVRRLYILAPDNVTPLVTPSGDVYYQLKADNLAGLTEGNVVVPASEMIHDRMNCLFHPLVGTSPLFACSLAARQGLAIGNGSASFFENGAQPGGILVAPGAISTEAADRLKRQWEDKFSGANRGRIAVLGDGMKYEPLMMKAVDAQLVEQLKMTSEIVCSVFHVPGYMVGIGTAPTYHNVEALAQNYYSQCLQSLIEAFEQCMDRGLSLPSNYRTELDLDGLLRMDTSELMKTLAAGVGAGVLTPNEARRRLNLKAIKGGDTAYMQQQNYSLAALDDRDRTNPLGGDALP